MAARRTIRENCILVLVVKVFKILRAESETVFDVLKRCSMLLDGELGRGKLEGVYIVFVAKRPARNLSLHGNTLVH